MTSKYNTTTRNHKSWCWINTAAMLRHVSGFWRQVDPQWTEQLAEEWAYGIDLEVFDYSLQSYFEGIGMADYLDS